MPRNSSGGVGGMFDDLKSRLGFGGNNDDAYNEEYGDYEDDFDEYDDPNGDYAGYGREYNDEAAVGGFRPVTTSSSRRSARGDLSSNLVSIDDVKASTRSSDRLQRDSMPATDDRYASTRVGSRNVIDATAPAPSSPAHNAAMRDSRSRSEGLDSLFEPSGSRPYDPYEAYSSSTTSAYSPVRSLTVIKPVVYGDVERVARAVKSGDVVVLVMRNTPNELSKRILDFSFGVASALDANVECPGDKVFAIARGNALSEDEKQRLRNQGAL